MNEIGYLNLLSEVLNNGEPRHTRNGNTLSIFGPRLEFNLKDQFPLITTKKMFVKGIFSELLWFLNGKTDNKLLQNQGVHIWDGNSSREYLDNFFALKGSVEGWKKGTLLRVSNQKIRTSGEKIRENYILSLGNTFIRYNPNIESFDLSNVIRDINKIVFLTSLNT